jgi:D-alanyl-D-alanine carboxypeptidase
MRIARRLAPGAVLTFLVTLAACGESDDPNRLTRLEPPTAEESAMGADGVEPGDHDHDGEVDELGAVEAPVEDSSPFLEPTPEAETPDPAPAPAPVEPPKVDPPKVEAPPAPADLKPTETCKRTTGYRAGKAFSICVTPIDGKLVEVNTARVFLKMRAAAKARGVAVRIVSGFRTMEQQKYLYNCYLTKKCNNGNLAARPGYSNHQSGHALDLNTSAGGVYTFLANRGSAYGFRRTVPSERWHWERW